MTATAAVLGVLAASYLALAALTGLGQRRRGGGWPVTVLGGATFPVAWVVWYLRDRTAGRLPAAPG